MAATVWSEPDEFIVCKWSRRPCVFCLRRAARRTDCQRRRSHEGHGLPARRQLVELTPEARGAKGCAHHSLIDLCTIRIQRRASLLFHRRAPFFFQGISLYISTCKRYSTDQSTENLEEPVPTGVGSTGPIYPVYTRTHALTFFTARRVPMQARPGSRGQLRRRARPAADTSSGSTP
jgi:hypothetical protein